MTRRLMALALLTVTVGGVAMLTSSEARSQLGVAKNYIQLQAATPGTAQSGHGNVSGSFSAGRLIASSASALPTISASNSLGANGAIALQAKAEGTTGITVGILAESLSNSGFAIIGRNRGTWGDSVGIQGETFAPFGLAVVGLAQNTDQTSGGAGGYFKCLGTNGTGAILVAESPNGTAIGGQSNATGNIARGFTSSATGTQGAEGLAVFASAQGSTAVTAQSTSTTSQSMGAFVSANGPTAIGVHSTANGSQSAIAGKFITSTPGGTGLDVFCASDSGNSTAVKAQTAGMVGTGLFAEHRHDFGAGFGIVGRSTSGAGIAISGTATAPTGATVGVLGSASSAAGLGIQARNTASAGGVAFEATASGSSGVGVRSRSSSSSGSTIAGEFTVFSPDGIGILGRAFGNAGSSIGIRGESASTTGKAVAGIASASTGLNYGVWGQTASATGFGVFSSGSSGATGTKSFMIDDPRDPENKMLLHFSHEGPEPQNVYNGSIVTDEDGFATVKLPGYFADINTDPRIQLSVVDSSDDFVMAKITQEVEGNQFRIRTSKPRVKVFWEVKAIRNDAFVRKNGFQVEREKPEHLRGKYLDPASHGLPDTKGMSYRPRQDAPVSTPNRPSARPNGAGPAPRRPKPVLAAAPGPASIAQTKMPKLAAPAPKR